MLDVVAADLGAAEAVAVGIESTCVCVSAMVGEVAGRVVADVIILEVVAAVKSEVVAIRSVCVGETLIGEFVADGGREQSKK